MTNYSIVDIERALTRKIWPTNQGRDAHTYAIEFASNLIGISNKSARPVGLAFVYLRLLMIGKKEKKKKR